MNRSIQIYFAIVTILLSLIFSVNSANAVTILYGKPTRAGSPSAMQGKTKTDEGKMKSCQAREESIKKRSGQLTEMATNMMDKFDAIAQKIEDYYNSKVVPSGKSVSNYNSLISDIQTKKAAVQTVLTKAQNDINNFSCTSDNPKGQLVQFRVDMQVVKRGLMKYRNSIKNLIVAVHKVTGVQNSERSATPRPSKIPKGDNK